MRIIVFILFGIFLSQSTIAQESNFRVVVKTLDDGTILSRVVTFDSLDVMRLMKGHVKYQLLSGNTVARTKDLYMGDSLQLRALYKSKPEFYLSEMLELVTDPDQPTTLDATYPYLIFLSYFTFDGAEWLGLGTKDKVQPGLAYTIKYTLVDASGKSSPIGEVKVKYNEWPTELIPPDAPKLECGNKVSTINLNASNTKAQYFGFNAQRRKKGAPDWYFIAPRITINPYYESKYGEYRYHYKLQDTLEENHVEYEYRMVGMDFFGGYGPPGKTSVCYGWEPLSSYAVKDMVKMVNDSTALIQWMIDDSTLYEVKSVDILVGRDSAEGNYEVLLENLKTDVKEVQVLIPSPIGFYRFRTIPKYGDTIYSFPFFIERWDIIPPVTPMNLEGFADISGIVSLSWDMNTEKDLWGYRIFYANNKKDEFSLLTSDIIRQNYYCDTINLANLTPEIYYRIVALDYRGNISPFSEIFTLEKPDTIPPATPLIKKIKQFKNSASVILQAVGGGSKDLAYHILFRKEINGIDFLPIDTLGIMVTDSVLIDTTTEFKNTYEYKILALDKHNNKSWSEPASVEIFIKGLLPMTKNIQAVKDTLNNTILFTWEAPKTLDSELEIYRKNDLGRYVLYKVVAAKLEQFKDHQIRINDEDEYKARFVNEDGTLTNMENIKLIFR